MESHRHLLSTCCVLGTGQGIRNDTERVKVSYIQGVFLQIRRSHLRVVHCVWLHAADVSRDLEKIPEALSQHRLPAGQLPASSRASSSFCLEVAPQPPALSKTCIAEYVIALTSVP